MVVSTEALAPEPLPWACLLHWVAVLGGVGSADMGTTELGHSSESWGLQESRGLFLKENLFMLIWVSLSLFYGVNSKVYPPVVLRTPRE